MPKNALYDLPEKYWFDPRDVFCKQTREKKYYWRQIGETEIKQIMSENPTWKFVFYYATPKRFSSIKVGLYIFLNLNSFKTKDNDLQIHLYGLVSTNMLPENKKAHLMI